MKRESIKLEQLIAAVAAARASISKQDDGEAVYAFTQAVNQLGYFDYQAVQAHGLRHDDLAREAAGYLRRYLQNHPQDFVALNNLGVLLANAGKSAEPRRCFRAALKLAPQDRNIHENLRILDIATRKRQSRWHDVPGDVQPGERTLVSYFDPHGM
jgi:Flp pilus assembly protein TadD